MKVRCYHSGPEWTWEQWQWRGTPHSPKLQHCWNLTIRLFSVISRTLVRGWVLPLCRGAVSVFYSPTWLGKLIRILLRTSFEIILWVRRNQPLDLHVSFLRLYTRRIMYGFYQSNRRKCHSFWLMLEVCQWQLYVCTGSHQLSNENRFTWLSSYVRHIKIKKKSVYTFEVISHKFTTREFSNFSFVMRAANGSQLLNERRGRGIGNGGTGGY